MSSYATVEEYRTATGDMTSTDERIELMLEEQSATLRAICSLSTERVLTEDQQTLARALVVGSVSKALIPPSLSGLGDITGASQASFSVDGFQSSVTLANPSGTAYFDRTKLAAFKRSLKCEQRIGYVWPGGMPC